MSTDEKDYRITRQTAMALMRRGSYADACASFYDAARLADEIGEDEHAEECVFLAEICEGKK